MTKLDIKEKTGDLPRLITPSILWTGGCLAVPFGLDKIHCYMSAYLIKGSQKTLLVDTGNPYHNDTILPEVRAFLDGRPLDYVFATHYEWPHAGLLPNWMDEYPNAVLVGDLPETDLYYPEYANRVMQVKPGDTLDLGDRELVFLPAIWRDIETLWAFDTKDRVLFASDAFPYFHYHHHGECDHLTSETPEMNPGMVQLSTELTMAWGRSTNAKETLEDITRLVTMLKPELIAPAHGNVVDQKELFIPRVELGAPAVTKRLS